MYPSLFPLILFCFVAAFTPGPNNILGSYSGFNFGIKKSIHLPIAAALGTTIIQFSCCLGLGTILIQFPMIQKVLKFIGFFYLIYLAYQISIFKLSNEKYKVRKINFLEYFSFQFINPKLYIFASSTSLIFTNYSYNFIFESTLIAIVMGISTIIGIGLWVFAGNTLLNLFKNNLQRKITNYFLSLCLLITAIWIVLT